MAERNRRGENCKDDWLSSFVHMPKIPKGKRNKRANKFEDYRLSNLEDYPPSNLDDPLSNLTDHILHYILSFVDTKFAVQTCVLSKRFRNLWKTLPDLNFDIKNFNPPTSSNLGGFIEEVLSHRKPSININKFSVTYDFLGMYYVHSVFCRYLVSHKIKELIFRVNKWVGPSLGADYPLLRLLISMQSLNSLVIEAFDPKILAGGLGFVGLKYLHLSKCNSSYESEEPFDPFSGCPNLKRLYISEFKLQLQRTPVFRISGPQLVDLSISDILLTGIAEIEVLAPALNSFSFMNSLLATFALVDLPALSNANVQIFLPSNQIASQFTADVLTNMLQMLRHAQSLTLSYCIIQVLSKAPYKLERQPSPFRELKKLKLTMPQGENSIMIPSHVMTYLLGASAYSASFKVEEQRNTLKMTL